MKTWNCVLKIDEMALHILYMESFEFGRAVVPMHVYMTVFLYNISLSKPPAKVTNALELWCYVASIFFFESPYIIKHHTYGK